jgi:hypothetical protein
VLSVRADAPLGEVLDAVTSTRLNRAIVVDADRRVLGIVTDADLLARLDPAGQTGLLGALMGRTRFGGELRVAARDIMRTPALIGGPDRVPRSRCLDHPCTASRTTCPLTPARVCW